MISKVALAVIGGVIVGGVAGFTYTRKLKKTAPSFVKTGYKDGVAYATFDANSALVNALPF